MACLKSRLTHLTLLTALTVGVSSTTLAQGTCDPTKETIAAKIRANGATNFELLTLDRDATTPHKIVGTCDGGRKKIAYARGVTREQADAAQAPAAVAPKPTPAAPTVQAPATSSSSTPPTPPPTPQAQAPQPPTAQPIAPAPTVASPAAPTANRAAGTPSIAEPAPAAPPVAPPLAKAPPAQPANDAQSPAAAKPAESTAPGASAKAPTVASSAGDAEIWKQGEERQCHQVKPKGWTTDRAQVGSAGKTPAVGAPISQYETDILPPAGHPLAQKGLVLSFRMRPYYVHELRPAVMATYANLNAFNTMVKKSPASLTDEERDLRSTLDGPDAANADDWQRTRKVAPEPGLIDGVGVVRLQLIQTGNWNPAEPFAFRVREQGKDATVVAGHKIPRWSDGVAQRAQVVLDPQHRRSISAGPLADRLVYEFGCWASNEMPAAEFASVCSAFIERSTMAEAFPGTGCVSTSPETIAFAPR